MAEASDADSAGASAFETGATLRPAPESLLATVLDVGRGDDTQRDAEPGGAGFAGDVFAHYEILEEIGRGGMAHVYRARQARLGREVAIKRSTAAYAPAREKFLAEARVTGQLDHPGIVPLYDLLVAERGEIALAMRLVRGTSWKELLHAGKGRDAVPRDLDFHLGVLVSVANAVAFAHSKHIAHNDLKPANVMVGEFGEVLVVDWGMALDFRDTPADDAVAPHKSLLHAPSGTPAYWPPELAQGRGSAVGPWTDVYLLGAILHEIAMGEPPHRGGSLLTSILEAVESDAPPFPPGAPAGLEAISRRAMAAAPADRYPTVLAFRDALHAFSKNRESLTITAAATATLEQTVAAAAALERRTSADARGIRVYADFADAASAFRQALVLWPENAAARAGERRAMLAVAGLALENGDLGLAEVQVSKLEADDPEAQQTRAAIAAAFAERARQQRYGVWLRRGLASAITAIVLGLSVGILVIRAEHRRTEESRALALARLADLRRLADVKRLSDYIAEADALWPARLDKVAAMEAWLVKARVLAGHLDGHRAYLAELRRHASRDESAPGYRFAGAEEQWEHDTLAGLVAGIEDFATTLIPDVQRRIEVARTVRARTLEDPAPAEAWRRATASIADPAECPRYRGLHLAPQIGLVPLGRDPGSGLWEFAHVESGEPAGRDAAGKLSLAEATGVVLVLLPGGDFAMGTRRPDADHPARLAQRRPRGPRGRGAGAHGDARALFAKYELTQGQWLRTTGSNPSAYTPGRVLGGRTHTLVHPVEQIGWKEADQMLWRLGLRLPTEAQWETAARGGTTTVFPTGDARESLQGFGQPRRPRYRHDNGGPGSWPFELWLDDGYVVHAPVVPALPAQRLRPPRHGGQRVGVRRGSLRRLRPAGEPRRRRAAGPCRRAARVPWRWVPLQRGARAQRRSLRALRAGLPRLRHRRAAARAVDPVTKAEPGRRGRCRPGGALCEVEWEGWEQSPHLPQRRRRENTSAAPSSMPASEVGADGSLLPPPLATLQPLLLPGLLPRPPEVPLLPVPVPLLPVPLPPFPAEPPPAPTMEPDVVLELPPLPPDVVVPVPVPVVLPAPVPVVAVPVVVVLPPPAPPPPVPPPLHAATQLVPRQLLKSVAAGSVVQIGFAWRHGMQLASLAHAVACEQHEALMQESQVVLPVVSPQLVVPLELLDELVLTEALLLVVVVPLLLDEEVPPPQVSG